MCKTKKTELLFLALFVRMLKVGGRCACIVPDGVLFGSSKAHKDIRKEIVENQRLEAVISMPSGVFKPYAGVSTAILIFTKTEHGGTDNVWFYDMQADGFSLDDKRSPIADNDIPDIIEDSVTVMLSQTENVQISHLWCLSRISSIMLMTLVLTSIKKWSMYLWSIRLHLRLWLIFVRLRLRLGTRWKSWQDY